MNRKILHVIQIQHRACKCNCQFYKDFKQKFMTVKCVLYTHTYTVVAAYCGHLGPGATVHINRRSTITEITPLKAKMPCKTFLILFRQKKLKFHVKRFYYILYIKKSESLACFGGNLRRSWSLKASMDALKPLITNPCCRYHL